ncbi:DUF261 family protein (plasmid) [Entomospira entomophila]|uniref:DUF261 family protein n=1 Tax=Entomospira entomophila TaxID=2719988 RepID=A0A968KUJ8_9SPIO|nr:DUF261 family protein [Entomospira entomophilus]NIZ41551.1 DUF261 family protein [Entomospira entomophilus]WDI36421.1 DUF261 family protein [Entomospira entomophilus]
MIKQNDSRLNAKIRAYGCNFLAHLAIARSDWLAEEVERVYQLALQEGMIDANCTVRKPQDLLALVGTPLRQLGGIVIENGESWGAKENDSKIRYRIARWRQRNSQHQHFTLWNHNGEIYDPYDADSASYKLEKLQLIGLQFYG